MLGDLVHDALELAGITQERVQRWLGPACGCEERRERLNALHLWAKKMLRNPGNVLPLSTWIDSMLQ